MFLFLGLPPTGSWQDLKDHMREAGDVCFADVYKDGTGACEYVRYEDMKYALKKLDDTKFKSHEVSASTPPQLIVSLNIKLILGLIVHTELFYWCFVYCFREKHRMFG